MIPFLILNAFIAICLIVFGVGKILGWFKSELFAGVFVSCVLVVPALICMGSCIVTVLMPSMPEVMVSKDVFAKQNDENESKTYLLTKRTGGIFFVTTEYYYFIKENNDLKSEKINFDMSKPYIIFTEDTPHIEISYCGKEYQAKLKKWSIIGYLFKADYSDRVASYTIYLPEGAISDELYAKFLE